MLGLIKFADPIEVNPADLAKQEALQKILGLGAAGLGIGAGGYGLLSMLNGGAKKKPARPNAPVPMDFSGVKLAFDAGAFVDWATSKLGGGVGDVTKSIGNFMAGNSAGRWYDVPWAIPGAVGAFAAGGATGAGLMHSLQTKRRDMQLDQQLTDAKTKYQQALSDQLSQKAGSLGAVLDELYEASKPEIEKRAGLGMAAGLGATVAGGSALLAGLAAYNYAKQRQESNVLAKAEKEHARMLSQTRPQPLLAFPPPGEPSLAGDTDNAPESSLLAA